MLATFLDSLLDLSSGWKIQQKIWKSGKSCDIFLGTRCSADGVPFGPEVCVKCISPATEKCGVNREPYRPEFIFLAIRMFFREVLLQAFVEHPAILPLRGWNIMASNSPNDFVVVTDRMAQSLPSRPSEISSLNLTATHKTIILYGIARGMSFLHSYRILHRDLKLDNVLLDAELFPRIADLGYAKPLTSLIQSGQFGTSWYMAPELWETEKYTFSADVFSYGMLLYALIEERPPQPPDGGQNWSARNANCRPKTHKISGPLSDILHKMWAHSPDKRPGFSEIVNLLKDATYHIPGTDEDRFAEYRSFLDREEASNNAKRSSRVGTGLTDLLDSPVVTGTIFQTLSSLTLPICKKGRDSARLVRGFLDWHGNFGPRNVGNAIRMFNEISSLRYIKFMIGTMRNNDPKFDDPLYAGVVEEVHGHLVAAAGWYRQAALLGDREAVMRYASLLLTSGADASGLSLLNFFSEQGDLNALCTLGDYYRRWKQDNARALKYFRKATQSDEYVVDSSVWFITGKLLLELERSGEARVYFEKVCEIDRDTRKWSRIAKTLLSGLSAD
jgi:serine/threonine protein kinase